MQHRKRNTVLISLAIVFVVAVLGSLATRSGMEAFEQLRKPRLMPPSYVFAIGWSVLYLLMAISAARIWLSDHAQMRVALTVYAIQLMINGIWCYVFFGAMLHGWALLLLVMLWLWVLVMIIRFCKIDRVAGLLQLPYILWLSFAVYLNFSVWLLN